MRKNWKEYKIKDIIEGLFDGPHATPSPSETGPVFLGVKNLNEDGRLDLSQIKHIAEKDFSRWTKRVLPQENDVVFIYEASLHRYGLLPHNLRCCLGRRMALLRLDKRQVLPQFLLYYFLSSEWRQTMEQNVIVGATVKRIPISDFPKFKLSLPLMEEQCRIANVLSDIDAKIDLNNRINTELENLARTIYDYWFLQFDFPDAAGRPYRSSGGAMRFDAGLGRDIPVKWEVNTFSELIAEYKGGDWGKEAKTGNYVKHVTCLRGTDLDGLSGIADLSPPDRFILEKNSHKILSAHDLIVEISGGSPTQSTGRLGYVSEYALNRFNKPLICSNFCKALTLKDSAYFYYFVMHWKKAYDQGVFFNFEGKTSGIKNLLFDSAMASIRVALPPRDVVLKFYHLLNEFDAKKQLNLKENTQLANLRDWLLPLLMSGEVTVGDTQ
ncbi:restriction endonuclease subunit S [Neolewinella antarctica]|nr:restriction endonuclease subunit S [Neolewinella antarctica]